MAVRWCSKARRKGDQNFYKNINGYLGEIKLLTTVINQLNDRSCISFK